MEMRETNSSLEVSRESVERQLAGRVAELEKARITIGEMEREIINLKDRCNRYVTGAPPVIHSVFPYVLDQDYIHR